MSFFSLLEQLRPEIETAILAKLRAAKTLNRGRFAFDGALFELAAARAARGKLMRGGLLVAAYEACGGTDRASAVAAAAALELYGTGLLMQDDVTDRSRTRRGLPAIQLEAAQLARANQLSEPEFFGDNCGFYLGDILFFLAQELMSSLAIDPPRLLQIHQACAHELWLLGLAQLEDVRLAQLPAQEQRVTEAMILQMLAGKTGRYSVAWPLRVGLLLAGASEAEIESAATIGEELGVLFQLRDDELGLFGKPEVTGKPVGDDLQEGKKTLYWLQLREKLPAADELWRAFGNPTATDEAVAALSLYLREAGIEREVHEMMLAKQRSIKKTIKQAKLTPALSKVLDELLDFVIHRKK